MERSIRRYQSYLTISGTAVILFSIWSLCRFSIYLYTHPTLVLEWMEDNWGDESQLEIMQTIMAASYAVVCGIIVLFNVYIGRSARREGRGEKGGVLYLILSALYLTGSLLSSFSEPASNDAFSGVVPFAAGMIVDVSCTFAHINVLYSAVRLRLLMRKKD